MKKNDFMFVGYILLSLSYPSFAAKPVKITPGVTGETDGEKFRNYIVECSDGQKKAITAWGNGKKWCVGRDSLENCAKKQIKTAKAACKKG